MDYAPSIDWALALRVTSTASTHLPELSERELKILVADLRVTAHRAGQLAAEQLGLDSAGARQVRVVDWSGWGRAVRGMVESVVAQLDLPPRPQGVLTRPRAIGNALLLGIGLRTASRRLLGQYDAYSGADTLYLVAPTIVAHEKQHRFVPADFRLWVSLHEQTHALQFAAAPWLRQWIGERISLVFADDATPLQGLLGWSRSGDLASLLASGPAGEALAQLVATMTFLEGHADHTADSVGRIHVPTVSRLRKAFTRGDSTKVGRFSRILDKNAQYRDGLAFCQRAVALRGTTALRAAFASPENLPRPDEIATPRAWIDRVHG